MCDYRQHPVEMDGIIRMVARTRGSQTTPAAQREAKSSVLYGILDQAIKARQQRAIAALEPPRSDLDDRFNFDIDIQ